MASDTCHESKGGAALELLRPDINTSHRDSDEVKKRISVERGGVYEQNKNVFDLHRLRMKWFIWTPNSFQVDKPSSCLHHIFSISHNVNASRY